MAGLSHTVSGDIASFRTPSRVPIESLKFRFLPKQADGMPTPENPIPIEGWTGVNGNNINGVVPNISNNNGMEKSGKIWRNTSLDSKTKFDAYIQLYKNSTYIKNAGYKSIADPGVYSITFNVDDSNCNRIVLIHSGSQTNLGIKFDFNLPLGTYTLSFKAISVNPSISGGLSLRDIFIIAGENVESEVFPITFPVVGKNKFNPNAEWTIGSPYRYIPFYYGEHDFYMSFTVKDQSIDTSDLYIGFS